MGVESSVHLGYERLNEVETTYDVFKFLKSLVSEYGFSQFSMIFIPVQGERELKPHTVISNWPPELLRAYDDMKLLSNSPIIKAVRNSNRPVEWELEEINSGRGASEVDRSIELFRSFGMLSGVYFPTYNAAGKKGAVSFSGDRNALSDEERAILHLLSLYAFNHASLLTYDTTTAPPQLTPRELECLGWAAHGKTNSEIGTILSISESTVAGYVIAVCQKLNASNKVHAVAKGLRLGLLD